MIPQTLKIGSRGSRLARVQVDEAITAIRPVFDSNTVYETSWFDTPGDRDRQTPLSDDSVPEDYFTRDLDNALLEGRVDLTIHSAKDLPDPIDTGVAVAALLPAKDIRDALVCREGWNTNSPPLIVGTSSPRRGNSIRKMYPHAETREIRGDIFSRIAQLAEGDYDAIVVAACALNRLGLDERINAYLPSDPEPQQGRLALVVRSNHKDLIHRLRPLDVRRNAGLVAIVGCPVDSSLLAERALRYIDFADIILHDRLVPDEILLRIQDRAETVGKQGGEKSITQSELNHRMLVEAEQGKLVVRLQGGDPGLFGHLGEELEFLDAWNIRTDVVPALTAAQVLAARARTALTHRHRGRSVTFISGHQATSSDPVEIPRPSAGNLAVYMPVANRRELIDQIVDAGWARDTVTLVGERLGYKDERVSSHRLGDLPELELNTPTVLLVGPHIHGPPQTTLFVGTTPENFLTHGPLIHWPLIKLVATPRSERGRFLSENMADLQGILFPSRFTIACVIEALHEAKLDLRALAGKKLLAVGPATALELRRVGLVADLAADSLGGVRDLVGKLTENFGGRYLYPCSDAAPVDKRMADFKPHGIQLIPAVFYRNRAMPVSALPRAPFQRVLFTSSSTVRVYFENYPEEKNAERIWVAVGPSTLETIESIGLRGEMLES